MSLFKGIGSYNCSHLVLHKDFLKNILKTISALSNFGGQKHHVKIMSSTVIAILFSRKLFLPLKLCSCKKSNIVTVLHQQVDEILDSVPQYIFLYNIM